MKKFDHELTRLRQRVIEMGNLTELMVSSAIDVVFDAHNSEKIASVLNNEEHLDQMQLEIDKEAIRLLTVYGPVATDLRFILSVSRINLELERIGDHATNICENVQLMISKVEVAPLSEVQKMAEVVRSMVHDALDAFLQSDHRKAQSVIAQDDLVDALNDQIIEELLSDDLVRKILAGPKDIVGALAQILIARSLERIADQATNISEEIVYIVKGDDIRHQSPMSEAT